MNEEHSSSCELHPQQQSGLSTGQGSPSIRLPHWLHPSNKGVALVLVLSILALLMLLVLGLLSLSRSEQRNATVFSQSIEVRTLADMPTDIVMGQIRAATSNLEATKSWASQPGMIRVFGVKAGKSGRSLLERAYKLYSSDVMIGDSAFLASNEATSLANWSEAPSVFTDLNEPVTTPSSVPGGTRRTFPILDPGANGTIDGFSLSVQAPGVTPEHPMPMPVRWLYLLKDGSLSAPEPNGSKAAFSDGKVTAENPIVGRIAFWTDDESCKVNLNTASEGTPWDVPRTRSWSDRNYAAKLPVKGEFQRYPGHPAMTSLSPILRAFDTSYSPVIPSLDKNGEVTNANAYVSFLKGIYALLPRTNLGESATGDPQSSLGGTVQAPATLVNGVPEKHERLFASVDEFFFNSNRGANAVELSPNDMQLGKFFLTAHSKAPETNLFNRPRISLWPQLKDKSRRTPTDKLIAHCSSCSLASASSASAEQIPQENAFWRSSFFENTAQPGSSQSTSEDFNLSQNQLAFGYLQDLTKRPIPGFGGSFANKYDDKNRWQILLQMFDYIRWGVNSWNAVYDEAGGKITLNVNKSYFYTPPRNFSSINPEFQAEASALPVKALTTPAGQIPNDKDNKGLKAFGRFPTITEACIVFMATEVEKKNGLDLDDKYNYSASDTANPDGWADITTKIRAYLLLQPFTPVVGMPPYTPRVRYVVEGMDAWSVRAVTRNGLVNKPLGFPRRGINLCSARGGGTTAENAHATAFTGMTQQFVSDNGTPKKPGVTNEDTEYPFVSDEIEVDGAEKFVFDPGGQPISVKIYSGFGNAPNASAPPVQEIKLKFPSPSSFPAYNSSAEWFVPRKRTLESTPIKSLFQGVTELSLENRLLIAKSGNAFRSTIIGPGDVARSLIVDVKNVDATGGDFRLLSALPVTPEHYFHPHPNYFQDIALLCDQNTDLTGVPDELDGRSVITIETLKNEPSAWSNEAQSLRWPGIQWDGMYGNQWLDPNDPRNKLSGSNISGFGYRQGVSHAGGYLLGTAKYNKFDGTKPEDEHVWYFRDCWPVAPKELRGAYKHPTGSSLSTAILPGDWDNGPGIIEDGPYINKPDESGISQSGYGAGGYYGRAGFSEDTGRSHAPNRQICSPVSFGSLPTGIYGTNPATSNQPMPWQTLLFCPNPPSRVSSSEKEATEEDHFGFKSPRDHLFLDLFWMPIVQPYAISEPMSTAGKINMNCQLMPFSYIKRSTGLHALFQSVRVNAMPASLAPCVDTKSGSSGGKYVHNEGARYEPSANDKGACYKADGGSADYNLKYETNYNVNTAETLKAFEARFDLGDIFRSASEICDVFLVPKYQSGKDKDDYTPDAKEPPTKYADMTEWWNGDTTKLEKADDGFELTGDNTRESPYNQLYPRLTTRSNVFQVHFRVQVLKKARSTKPEEWDDEADQVVADYRGSTVIERYLDPNDKSLPNFLADPKLPGSLDDYYRFRVLRTKQFSP